MIRNIQPKLLGFKSLLCIMDKLHLFLIVHRSTTDCQQCCQMSEQNMSMHAQHTCTCTQTCKRMHTQAHTEIERQRATKEKLRKPCVCNSEFCYVYNRKTIFILVSNHIFMQIYMHVFQDTFHTTKLLSEVRDWKALLSSLFT